MTLPNRVRTVAYEDMPIGEFLDAVASERVAPAGGSAVAIAGATGAALCEMACVHTLAARDESNPDGRDAADGSPQTEGPTLTELGTDLERQRHTLLALAEGDAELVDELFGGGEGPTERLRKRATGVPLAIAEASLAVLEGAAIVRNRARPGVAADAITGAYLADAAVGASLATVRANLETLSDEEFAAGVIDRVEAIEGSATAVRSDAIGADAGRPSAETDGESDRPARRE